MGKKQSTVLEVMGGGRCGRRPLWSRNLHSVFILKESSRSGKPSDEKCPPRAGMKR